MIEASHILVVEDDPLVSEVIEAALDDAYRVTVVDSATAALGLLRQGGVRLMLLDCTLPGGVDHNLLPEADDRGTAVIMMSGDPGRMDQLSAQARPFVRKPFTLGGLLATVEQVLATTPARVPQS
nr:response regulator [uncultured Rhodopila sp.]